ncbi:MAG: hypothetical protein Q8P52_01535 [bacterium]|nr:hypothetical protein [bacterium]
MKEKDILLGRVSMCIKSALRLPINTTSDYEIAKNELVEVGAYFYEVFGWVITFPKRKQGWTLSSLSSYLQENQSSFQKEQHIPTSTKPEDMPE